MSKNFSSWRFALANLLDLLPQFSTASAAPVWSFLLEKIPPPTPTTQYIQVHRLSGDENLSHLLRFAYHHYGAAKAGVFVSTSDEFHLHQDLLNTLPASSEEYSKLLSVLLPKSEIISTVSA